MRYRIPILKQISMYLRGTPVGKVKKELKKSESYNLDLDENTLEAQFLCGGDITDFTDSMIYAQENGISLDKQKAAACQLAIQGDGTSLLNKLKEMKEKGIVDIGDFLWGGPKQSS